MSMGLADAFDRIAHAEVLAERLGKAAAEMAEREGLSDEARWLADAHRRLERAREGAGDLSMRAHRLPEFSPMRDDGARTLQGAVVDALEGLQQAIVTEFSERSPLLELLFRNTKTSALRRCGREELEAFEAEMERRLTSSYATRMISDAASAEVVLQVAAFRRAVAAWRGIFVLCSDDEAAAVRASLRSLAERLDLPSRQARLLAEAALAALPDVRESSAIFDKPKRRAARALRTEGDGEASGAR